MTVLDLDPVDIKIEKLTIMRGKIVIRIQKRQIEQKNIKISLQCDGKNG
jgi:hypothetical protein